MGAPRLLLAASFLLAALSEGACSAPVEGDPDGTADEAAQQQEAELSSNQSDEESFASYDATEEELAKASPEAPLDNEMTLFAIPAPKLFGLKWSGPAASRGERSSTSASVSRGRSATRAFG